MRVLDEDTSELLGLIEQSPALYDDCYRIAMQTLEQFPPSGDRSKGVDRVALSARSELSRLLRNVLEYCDDAAIQDRLASAHVDWRDVAREFIVDVRRSEGEAPSLDERYAQKTVRSKHAACFDEQRD